jgi:hypothetical protein
LLFVVHKSQYSLNSECVRKIKKVLGINLGVVGVLSFLDLILLRGPSFYVLGAIFLGPVGVALTARRRGNSSAGWRNAPALNPEMRRGP